MLLKSHLMKVIHYPCDIWSGMLSFISLGGIHKSTPRWLLLLFWILEIYFEIICARMDLKMTNNKQMEKMNSIQNLTFLFWSIRLRISRRDKCTYSLQATFSLKNLPTCGRFFSWKWVAVREETFCATYLFTEFDGFVLIFTFFSGFFWFQCCVLPNGYI